MHPCLNMTNAQLLPHKTEGKRIPIGGAAADTDGREDWQNDGCDREDDQHRNADQHETQKRGDDRPEHDADLEVQNFLGLVLDERRIGDAHDHDRNEEIAEKSGGDQRNEMTDDCHRFFLACGKTQICIGHVGTPTGCGCGNWRLRNIARCMVPQISQGWTTQP